LLARYDALEEENKALRDQTEALRATTAAAGERVAAKEKQLADTRAINERMGPFLAETIGELRRLLDEGAPFLMEERRQRVDRLEALRDDPDVSLSEKYRKVMEALLVEAEYGCTLEVYRQAIVVENQPLQAEILRLGRLALFYLTLDGGRCGLYNEAAAAWQPLPDARRAAVAKAMDIGAKRQAAELLDMPLGRMVAR
jgi:hypothetical protein